MNHHARRAFTLTEMAMIGGIISMMMAVGAPAMSGQYLRRTNVGYGPNQLQVIHQALARVAKGQASGGRVFGYSITPAGFQPWYIDATDLKTGQLGTRTYLDQPAKASALIGSPLPWTSIIIDGASRMTVPPDARSVIATTGDVYLEPGSGFVHAGVPAGTLSAILSDAPTEVSILFQDGTAAGSPTIQRGVIHGNGTIDLKSK